jgi:hypothetical protein
MVGGDREGDEGGLAPLNGSNPTVGVESPVTPWAAVLARPSAAPTATPPTMCARST